MACLSLENKSIYIIREAYWRYRDKLAILWSCGKDSTTMIHLARKAFFGEIPMPVVHIDTEFKFKEIYRFRDTYIKRLNIKLIIAKNEDALRRGVSPAMGRFDCCSALKTEALKQAINRYGFRALLVGIRRDEHSVRAKERYFSPRDLDFRWDYWTQPIELWEQFYQAKDEDGFHVRIHPLLDWREIDVWRYIKEERMPVASLYFANNRKRYRSIGCACCCQPIESSADTIDKIIEEIESPATSERAGRAQDKEHMMQKLRSLGYM